MKGVFGMNRNLVGIISDTHDHKRNIITAVQRFNDARCSLVIHAGDFVAPFTAIEFGKLKCPFIGVFGNNDGERTGLVKRYESVGAKLYRMPYEFEYEGKRFIVMHEPDYVDDSLKRDDLDVIVYGHTHEIDIRPGRPMVINPGESCAWLTDRATAVILDLDTMKAELIDL